MKKVTNLSPPATRRETIERMAQRFSDLPELENLAGKRVLVTEDEYLLALELVGMLNREGAEVMGPFPTVEAAWDCLDSAPKPDLAMLDINLRGEMVFPVADRLIAAEVSVIFVTGYDTAVLPPFYAAFPRLEKPVDWS